MENGEGGSGAHTPDQLSRIWASVVAGATVELGQDCVDQWIKPIRLNRISKDHAVLATSTGFLADWVERNYGRQILRQLQKEVPGVRRIDMTVCGKGDERSFDASASTVTGPAPVSPPASTAVAQAMAAASAPAAQPVAGEVAGLESSPLDQRYSFDSFVVGKPNELAHAAARRVAETADASFNPVFFYGGVGRGKTHLMHAIGWQIAENFPERRVLYLSAEQFMYRFVAALRSRDTYTFKQQFRAVDVLMIDDVQFIAGKDSTQEEFFHTFNALVDQQKQIVLSADQSPEQIDGLENRIKSRLQQGLVVDIHPADYELRLGICTRRSRICARAIRKWCWIRRFWSFWRIGSRPMCGCWRGL